MKEMLFCLAFWVFCPGVTDGFVTELPEQELRILVFAAEQHKLSAEQTRLLLAIRCVEQGRPGREMGVLSVEAMRYEDGLSSMLVQAFWSAATIKKRYTGDLKAFAERYCPRNVDNDPTNLNQYWRPGVRRLMKKMGVK